MSFCCLTSADTGCDKSQQLTHCIRSYVLVWTCIPHILVWMVLFWHHSAFFQLSYCCFVSVHMLMCRIWLCWHRFASNISCAAHPWAYLQPFMPALVNYAFLWAVYYSASWDTWDSLRTAPCLWVKDTEYFKRYGIAQCSWTLEGPSTYLQIYIGPYATLHKLILLQDLS